MDRPNTRSNGMTQPTTETVGGHFVGETLFPDDSFEIDEYLSPAAAHVLARQHAPNAIIGLSTKVRACEVHPRTFERNGVFGGVWTNNLGLVVGVDPTEGTVTLIVRSGRKFSKRVKRYPAVNAAHEVADRVFG